MRGKAWEIFLPCVWVSCKVTLTEGRHMGRRGGGGGGGVVPDQTPH